MDITALLKHQRTLILQPWASEGFFLWGGSRGFSQNFFQGGPNVVKLGFYPSKLKKQPFFANTLKIQGGIPLAPPSDAHAYNCSVATVDTRAQTRR